MKNYFRNGCIAAVCSLSTGAAFAEGTAAADAAAKALDATQSDVTATSPKVMLVVATCVGVGILISLMRKA
ncbi:MULTISPECIES: major coat protein [Aeromonas]|uniref:major coat protein n=1 Tax=Aeromonas TaxID=642 RepID=UPI00029A3FC7|nr:MULTISPECIES: major coat protein [Aeromonas]ASX12040.1 Flexible pilin [Aeromonas dhakensis]MBF8449766.1 Flexible pilin [Aeromonas dhakensis]MBL0460041.1 Flexible pilin [Aeromonas dhakensis]MBL0525131.1 Flexible pilin [Aeromonas dhakensis]MBL0531869.1 Flexible pilin [Aeromonas dhakensis]